MDIKAGQDTEQLVKVLDLELHHANGDRTTYRLRVETHGDKIELDAQQGLFQIIFYDDPETRIQSAVVLVPIINLNTISKRQHSVRAGDPVADLLTQRKLEDDHTAAIRTGALVVG